MNSAIFEKNENTFQGSVYLSIHFYLVKASNAYSSSGSHGDHGKSINFIL